MDPVSNSLGLAKTIGQVSWKIYLFSNDVRHNNQALGDLASEVLSLHRAVHGITTTIENPAFAAAEAQCNEDSSELWSLVLGNLSDAQYTLKNFEATIWPLLPEKDNVAKQVLRTARLGLKQSEITSLRTRIQGHVNILSITLQTLTLRATYLAPGAILDKVLPAIAELRVLIQRNDSVVQLPPEMIDRVSKMRAAARKEMNSATTVASASEANLSIAGDPMPEQVRAQTLDWIQEPDYHHIAPEPTEGTTSSFSGSKLWSPAETERQTTTITDPTSGSVVSAEESDNDPDEDLQAELVHNWFKRGKKLFEEKRYSDAQSYLQKGVEHIEKLPVKRRDGDELKDVQLMIAQCACHAPNLNEAERRLMKITQETSATAGNEDAIRRCQAMHLLSTVLFREKNYAAAKAYCRKAITGRRRVLGAKHVDHFQSIYLMAQIWEAEGAEDAYQHVEIYLDMIPDDVKPKLIKIIDEYPGTPSLGPTAGPLDLPSDFRAHHEATLPPPSLPTPARAFAPSSFPNLCAPAATGSELAVSVSSNVEHSDAVEQARNSNKAFASGMMTPVRALAAGDTTYIASAPQSPHLPSSPRTADISPAYPIDPGGSLMKVTALALDKENSLETRPRRSRCGTLEFPVTSQHDEQLLQYDQREPHAHGSPFTASPSVRTPSIVSSNSSVYSADGTEASQRRRSFGNLFRRKSQPKPPSPRLPVRPASARSYTSPDELVAQAMIPKAPESRAHSVSMGMNAGVAANMEGRSAKQSLHEFLLERIAEENGQQKDKSVVEYPGLF